jgi:hypothetical protein
MRSLYDGFALCSKERGPLKGHRNKEKKNATNTYREKCTRFSSTSGHKSADNRNTLPMKPAYAFGAQFLSPTKSSTTEDPRTTVAVSALGSVGHQPLHGMRDKGEAQDCGEDGKLSSRRCRAPISIGAGATRLSMLSGVLTKKGRTVRMVRPVERLCARTPEMSEDGEDGCPDGTGRKGSWMTSRRAVG